MRSIKPVFKRKYFCAVLYVAAICFIQAILFSGLPWSQHTKQKRKLLSIPDSFCYPIYKMISLPATKTMKRSSLLTSMEYVALTGLAK